MRFNYGVADDGSWLSELKDLTRIDLERGVARLRWEKEADEDDSSYAVSCLDFKKLCFPTSEELGLPSEDRAFMLACHGNWDVHPIVHLSVVKIGFPEFSRMDAVQARRRFNKYYQKLVARVRAGYKLYMPVQKLKQLAHKPDDSSVPVVLIDAKPCDYIAAMRKILNGQDVQMGNENV